MYSAILKEIDGAVVLEIPADLLESLHLHAGEAVNMRVEQGVIALSARMRNTPSLEEMLAECNFSIPPSAEEIAWDQARPIGRELI